jgi:hypothetical protein
VAITSTAPAGLLRGKPFAAGYDPRRSAGPVSVAERNFRRLLEADHIPKASALLTSIYDRAMAGDMAAAAIFFKVCGLIQKPKDDAIIQAQARAMLDAMIEEARVRLEEGTTAER